MCLGDCVGGGGGGKAASRVQELACRGVLPRIFIKILIKVLCDGFKKLIISHSRHLQRQSFRNDSTDFVH